MTADVNRRDYLAALGGAVLAAPAMSRAAVPGATDAPASSEVLEFLAIGDWGQHGSAHQRLVAAGMAELAAQRRSRFVVSLGDNFYKKGVETVDDRQWRTSFEDVYAAASLQCPWYPVLGNHDRKGQAMAQVAYSQVSERWRMPAPYYWRGERLVDGTRIDLFFLDTTMIVSENSGLHRVVPGDDADDQMAWLDQALSASKARWKIVVGHHPVYSGGRHGPTRSMISVVKPILERHRVSAYVCGHDHCMQHIASGGITYIVCGTGASLFPVGPTEGTVFAESRLGFLNVRATRDALTFEFRAPDLQVVHAASIDVTR